MNERNPETQPAEVTIKFSRKLMGDPFTSKSGRELVEIRIPNPDPNDKRPWETCVVPANRVHDNKFSKGVWMKLPEDSTTNLNRRERVGVDQDNKPIWQTKTRTVANTELKSLIESYKNRDRDSVLGTLAATERKSDPPDKSRRKTQPER